MKVHAPTVAASDGVATLPFVPRDDTFRLASDEHAVILAMRAMKISPQAVLDLLTAPVDSSRNGLQIRRSACPTLPVR